MPTSNPTPEKKKGARFGRPSKLTPELTQRIAEVVRAGCYLDTAARFCGVSKGSFHDWLKKGHEQQRGKYRDFLNALEEAQAAADVRDHARVTKAAEKDWKAAVAHLKLRNPGRYAVTRVEASGPDGRPIAPTTGASQEIHQFNGPTATTCDRYARRSTAASRARGR
jgi:hypothetical protein